MAVSAWGQLFIQPALPAEDPVMVGSLWSDTTAFLLKRCTSVSPFTFVSVEGGGGGAPVDAEYIVGALNAVLTAERLVTDTPTVAWDLATAGQAKANVPDNAITNLKLRDSAAQSVIGRASAVAGDPADIVAPDETVLGRTGGGVVDFGQIQTLQIVANAVTNARLRDSAAQSVIGRASAVGGDPADIVAADATVLGRTGGGVVAFGAVQTDQVANDAVTDAKLRNSAAVSVIGRAAAAGGDPADIVAGADAQFLSRHTGTLAFAAIVAADLPVEAVRVLNRKVTTTDVTNTAVETVVYTFSVPANAMGANRMLRLTLLGDLLFNNLAADSLTLRVRFGGTLFYRDAMLVGAISASRSPSHWIIEIANRLTNEQQVGGFFLNGTQGGATTGIGNLDADEIESTTPWSNITLGAIDTTLAQTLEVSAQWSVANVNDSCRVRYGVLELI